jgi:hypothetical protein
MGDVVSFVEKAQKIVDEKEAEEMAKKMMAATFDFDDFLKQSNMVKQMGNMAGTILTILLDPFLLSSPFYSILFLNPRLNSLQTKPCNHELLLQCTSKWGGSS